MDPGRHPALGALLRVLPRFVWLVPLLGACAPPRAPSAPDPTPDQRSIPKIDLHAHFWRPHPELVPALQRWRMRAVLVNVASDGLHEQKWRGMRELHAEHPERFVLASTFDPQLFNEPDFPQQVIARLRQDVADGARMVKVWKNVGLELKDREGRQVLIDDPRFQPIWDFLASAGIPVLAHIAEPRAAWLPLDERSPHHWYYKNHPQYHAFQHPEMPRWETLIAARDRWVARNPRLIIVGAHLGSLEHDVAEIARRLDAYPNFHVETAARINDLAMQPSERVRDFMIRYQDRIFYGTDVENGTVAGNRLDAVLAQHWSYFAGPDSVLMGSPQGWNVRARGLALPPSVLAKLYHENAERLLGLSAHPDRP